MPVLHQMEICRGHAFCVRYMNVEYLSGERFQIIRESVLNNTAISADISGRYQESLGIGTVITKTGYDIKTRSESWGYNVFRHLSLRNVLITSGSPFS